jgi:inner membrane protein
MTGRTHDLAAVTSLGVVLAMYPVANITLATALISLLANQIGGIFPDIDQPTAPFWRNLPIGGFFGRLIDKMLGGHRFLTHSLIGLGLFGLLSNLLLKFIHPLMPHVNIHLVWLAFMIGLSSHLVMDTFTKEGVPWLLPIPVKFGIPPFKGLRITTGKKLEKALFLVLGAADIIYLARHYRHLIVLLKQILYRS